MFWLMASIMMEDHRHGRDLEKYQEFDIQRAVKHEKPKYQEYDIEASVR